MSESAAKPAARAKPRARKPSPAKAAADAVVDVAKAPVTVTKALIPDGRSVAAYAGLATVAALGILEWPLAAAAGVGWLGAKLWAPHPAVPTDTAPAP